MPNARKKGLKLAAAFVTDQTDAALVKLAKKQGFPDKASFLRSLIDQAVSSDDGLAETPVPYITTPRPTSSKPSAKPRGKG